MQGQEPLTASMLAAAPPQEQKQMLGEMRRLEACPAIEKHLFISYPYVVKILFDYKSLLVFPLF